MKKIGLGMMSLIIGLTGCVAGINAKQKNTPVNPMGVSVSAVLPSNQFNKNHTYFDLLVKPGEDQKLTVNLTNATDDAQEMITAVTTAKTNVNGVVEYAPSKNKLDQTIPFDLGKATDFPKKITVPAHQTVPFTFTIHVPNQTWPGIVAGGVSITQAKVNDNQQTKKKAGISILNRYAYAIGIVMQTQADHTVPEKLTLKKVTAGQVSLRNAVMSELHNKSENYINRVAIQSKVYRANSKKVLYESKRSNMQIAPNTVFNYPLSIEGTAFKAGRYRMKMTVKSSHNTWYFTKNFTISAAKAKTLNAKDVSIVHDTGIPWWIWLIIVCLAGLSGVLVFVVLKRKKQDQTN
ncbi:DUF916 and DUF3324 domain-containing protein [Weissella diestrammenae]|uniref:DUF916 and DUF3324 domain-containing protein n=1 Tax=Weissella diestrammenae TaxID=1162633 RepID=A0A7G9T722_9LACO|nr:DUF916 and DUF3324 domain-containing protein [Weissella diestrammenae]MCM0582506.1 DUF916 and DUF3324 domain-containing protein [Weissella diestrammenae]QNN75897.1 DUF916 and DUF3324 domain-containing protein [Weissella diestrammenae]